MQVNPQTGRLTYKSANVGQNSATTQPANGSFCVESVCLGMPPSAADAALKKDGYKALATSHLNPNSFPYERGGAQGGIESMLSYKVTHPIEPFPSSVALINRKGFFKIGLTTFDKAITEKYGHPTMYAGWDRSTSKVTYGYFYALDGTPSPNPTRCVTPAVIADADELIGLRAYECC